MYQLFKYEQNYIFVTNLLSQFKNAYYTCKPNDLIVVNYAQWLHFHNFNSKYKCFMLNL